MAFGFLSSIIPGIDQNVTLYSSPADTLTQGKVSISSKNTNPVRIRLSIRENAGGATDLKYLEYNRYIAYGETFETGEINLGGGQQLVVRSDHSDVNFLLHGSTIDESTANLGSNILSGLLGTVLSTDSTKKELYRIPTDLRTEATVVICNLNSFPAKARLGLVQEVDGIPAFGAEDYIEYDVVVPPNQTYVRSGIKLGGLERIICSSSADSKLQFALHGRLKTVLTASEDDLTVAGNVISQGVGIGTNPRNKLDVIGNAIISGGINAIGIVTASAFDGALDAAQLSGILPALDGSALTGVTATGTGITIEENGTPVGTAKTVDFGSGITAEFSAGIATMSVSSSVDVSNMLTVNSNKFVVEGSTGNTTIAGQLNANSNVQVSGQINVLNNNIINVGQPTSSDHAVPKSYVDSKTTAMSIALS